MENICFIISLSNWLNWAALGVFSFLFPVNNDFCCMLGREMIKHLSQINHREAVYSSD